MAEANEPCESGKLIPSTVRLLQDCPIKSDERKTKYGLSGMDVHSKRIWFVSVVPTFVTCPKAETVSAHNQPRMHRSIFTFPPCRNIFSLPNYLVNAWLSSRLRLTACGF